MTLKRLTIMDPCGTLSFIVLNISSSFMLLSTPLFSAELLSNAGLHPEQRLLNQHLQTLNMALFLFPPIDFHVMVL